MTKQDKDDGGPAFPESYIGADSPHEGIGMGMSLRAWFAGMVSASNPMNAYEHAEAARWAVERADALLAELKK